MIDDADLQRIVDSMASGKPVDWDRARGQAASDDDLGRLEALRDIERVAAFSHAQWERFSPLLDQALAMHPSVLEIWLTSLDAGDAADLRRALQQRGVWAAAAEPSVGEAAGTPSDVIAGQSVGAYTLESPLGEGGMGAVWLARRSDGRFETRVAIKLLHLPRVDRDGLARFQREGHILARLRHPNIAQLMDAGVTAGGQPYLVLEHVDGVAIDRYCELHALDVRARVELFLDVLAAVAHAQTNLVLHRDLKPSNILVDQQGHVKLLDFGIAKLLEDEGAAAAQTELTQRAGQAFTPEFAAPEQLLGNPVTTATDVYAAGVVLYALLTGAHPTAVARPSPLERMQAILEATPRAASEAVVAGEPGQVAAAARTRRELKGDLDNILSKALKKSPEERYATASAFADDLRRYLNREPVVARPDTITYRLGRFVRRHRAAVASASVAVAALVAMTSVAVSQLFEARRQRDEARAQTSRAEAFNTVVTSLLSQTGPGGRPLTQEELLDHAVDEMRTQYANDPAFLVDMLIRISGRYLDISNSNKELATLVEAEQIARRRGDPMLLFRVQNNTVETELTLGHRNQARQRMHEAESLLAVLRPKPSLREFYRAEAQLARAHGDMPAALDYMDKTLRVLEAEGRTGGNSYVSTLSYLRFYRALAGDIRPAHDYAVRWVAVEKQYHREATASGVNARCVLASSFYAMGEVDHALRLFEEVTPEFKAIGTDHPPEPDTRAWSYGEILSRMGRHDQAIRTVRFGVDSADRGGNQGYALRSRLALACALLRAGRPLETARRLDQADSIMASDPAANHPWIIEASRLRAETALAVGQPDQAQRHVDDALHRLGYPEKTHGPGLPRVLLTLSRVQLAGGQAAPALATAQASEQLFEKDTLEPLRSADVGEAWLAVSRAQAALHDAGSAKRSAERAATSLRNGLGPEHELVREAQRLSERQPS